MSSHKQRYYTSKEIAEAQEKAPILPSPEEVEEMVSEQLRQEVEYCWTKFCEWVNKETPSDMIYFKDSRWGAVQISKEEYEELQKMETLEANE